MLYLYECNSWKPDDLLTRNLSLNLLFKALIYSLLLQIQNIGFHGHFSLMQCQLIRSQVRQLPPESLHYHNLHLKKSKFLRYG